MRGSEAFSPRKNPASAGFFMHEQYPSPKPLRGLSAYAVASEDLSAYAGLFYALDKVLIPKSSLAFGERRFIGRSLRGLSAHSVTIRSTKPNRQRMPAPVKAFLSLLLATLLTLSPLTLAEGESVAHLKHPYLFHLIQADLWQEALDNDTFYYPPTYKQDGFTHATANPDLLLNVANHFYTEVPGKWLCLRMTVASLKAAGVETIFEGTAPVGDKEANFEGTGDELFPHILGGITAAAVLEVHEVKRSEDGIFLEVIGVTQ